jgi:prepilin-type N-terminal cleavage/methylation domain-containing protein
MKANQKGFSVVEILIVTVIIGLLGAVGWLVYDRQNNKTPETSNTQASTTQKEETPKQETKKPDPNEGYLVVKEWGLRFKIPSGLTDVKYTIHGDTVSFFAKPTGSNVQYRADYDKFEEGRSQYAMGNLYRSTSSAKPFAGDMTREGKKVGDYYYYTSWAFSSLATGAGCVGLYEDSNESNCEPESRAFALVNGNDGNKAALLLTIELAQ